jgi:hypothetical protein
MSSANDSELVFTAEELDLLGRTADALSAYMGKPVLAEVVDASETGFEWVIFAIPLDVADNDDKVIVQVGGAGARILGNRGGLDPSDDIYDCEYLWAVQLSDIEGVRFIKVDQDGEEIAWSDDLHSVLPFALSDAPLADIDEDDEDGEDDSGDDDDLDKLLDNLPRHTLH